jgi:hypothetical protein
MAGRIAILLLMLSMAPTARAWARAPLASGGAPPCSNQNGDREFHSSVVQDGDVSALIVGIARRDASGCHKSIELRFESSHGMKSYPLPSDAEEFELVDFSPDGTRVFVADEQSADVQIAAIPIATGEVHWQDISDLLAWKDCEATVDPQGFTTNGELVVSARPSVESSPQRPNCVAQERLYAFDSHWKAAVLNADAASIKRVGKKAHPPSQACQSDPDLIGPCFTTRGRLSAWNGSPTFRIWRIGTRRIMGLTERLFPSDQVVLPESLDGQMNFDVDAYGDFMVCPITSDVPGKMQLVCVESAQNVTFKDR